MEESSTNNNAILQTILRQVLFSKLRLSQTADNERSKSEEDILKAWKTVHDAEEELNSMQIKVKVAEKIIDIHKRLYKLVIAYHALYKTIYGLTNSLLLKY
jgi:hypothetical protein